MSTPIYMRLDYKQYKAFEAQFAQGCGSLESFHRTEDQRYYHKAIRFELGDLEFEVTGPMVMAPVGQAAMEVAPRGYLDYQEAKETKRSSQEEKAG